MRRKLVLSLIVCGLTLALSAAAASAATMKTMKVGTQQAVSARTQEATLAGWEILEKGGNAFDAIVAEHAANQITNASSNGQLGADVSALVYVAAEKKVYSIDGEGTAPMLATIDWYNQNNDGIIPTSDGLLSGTVPGAVATWCLLLDRWGTMSLTEVLQPALRLMEQGYPASSFPSGTKLLKYPSSVAQFDLDAKGNSKQKPYDLLKFPMVATTMRKLIAAEQAALKAGLSRHDALMAARDRFYKGDIAQEMAAFSEKNGGLFRYNDFANYKTQVWDAVSINYRGYTVYSNANASNGPTALCWLNVLKNFDLKSMKHGSAEFLHTMIEAGKLAYADRLWLGDRDFYPIPFKGLLSEEYGKARAKLIDPNKASLEVRVGNPFPYQGTPTPPNPWGLTDSTPLAIQKTSASDLIDDTDWAEVHGDTSGVSVADKWGNVIVYTPSLHSGWGTGVTMGNTGVIFNCRGDYYYLDPLHPNALRPGERPNSTLMTVMVCDSQNRPVMTVASPGGDDQASIDTQCVVAFIDFGMDIQNAVECVRFDLNAFPSNVFPHTFYPGAVAFEGRIPADVQKVLADKGNKVGAVGANYAYGSQHALAFDYSHPGYTVYFAAADPRSTNDAMAK